MSPATRCSRSRPTRRRRSCCWSTTGCGPPRRPTTRRRPTTSAASELHRDGLLSKGDLDALEESYELARVALEQAQDNRELTREGRVTGATTKIESIIRAPAGGTVLSRTVNPGDPVVPLTSYQPGTELATIADMADLIFKGTVDEIDVGKIAVGMPCRIKIGALPDSRRSPAGCRASPRRPRRTTARPCSTSRSSSTRTSEVVLRAGYSANADLVIREKTRHPDDPRAAGAVRGRRRETFVERAGRGPGGGAGQGRGPARPVRRSQRRDRRDGLAEGDQVVQRPPREIGSMI